MNSSTPRPAIEILAETLAVLSLGGACAFAMAQAGSLAAALAAGGAAAGAAALVLRRVDGAAEAEGAKFTLMDFLFEEDDSSVLLLDDAVTADEDELLLDDPLPKVSDDSRVVRLFGAAASAPRAQPAMIAPGEMVMRIEHWLGGAASGGSAAEPAPPAGNVASEEAKAALHAALADIRRSLRQA